MVKPESEWATGNKSGLVSIGSHKLFANIRGPVHPPPNPLVIIFPGSGAACETWSPIFTWIASFARILLYDRSGLGRSEPGPDRDTGEVSARELMKLLKAIGVKGPYVLVAHSYGGCVAREFLQACSREVVGMVLSETGTEPKCRDAEEQYRRQILGDKPLSVIRGEASFQRAFRGRKVGDRGVMDGQGDDEQLGYRKILREMEELDERLKREQLKLSRNGKFRNVPDCGHSVHLERPDVVVEEVKWVLENVVDSADAEVAPSPKPVKLGFVSRLYKKVLRTK